ncbi:MAG TPA: hypothetical protein VGK74_19095 [Symbiobacteriaceae bacterium]
MKTQSEDRVKLVGELESNDDPRIVEAAKKLLALGDHGTPAGTYCLAGGKAALRLGRLADAVVLLYRGLKVAEPDTLLWAEMLVNRVIACSRHGFYRDAIEAGEQFTAAVKALPDAARWLPHVHHAVGFAHDRLREYPEAAHHFRLAVESYAEPARRDSARCDLASALAMSGHADEGASILAEVDRDGLTMRHQFTFFATAAVVRYHQGQYPEALAAAEQAEALAVSQDDSWVVPLAELQLWISKIVWELGDSFRSGVVGLHVAVVAQQRLQLALSQEATDWLAEIMARGGVKKD